MLPGVGGCGGQRASHHVMQSTSYDDWKRTSFPLMREIRRRTRVVGAFPDGKSALMLVAARLRHVAATKWGTKRCLQMNRLAEVRAIA
jgi:transposase-like protein